jgi:hypothetical protein
MNNNLFAVHVRNSSKKLEVSNKLLEIFNMKTLTGFTLEIHSSIFLLDSPTYEHS